MIYRLKARLRRVIPQRMKDFYRVFVPRSMKESFSEVYGRDDWNGGSGRGSTPENTVEYRKLLADFFESHAIQRIVDIGCGDWQSSRLIDWKHIDYIGIDTVPAVIQENRRQYGPRFKFECIDVTTGNLPHGDVVIIKDVLQHWPISTIKEFLPRLEQYRYAILTNCGYASPMLNENIAMSGYRPLDLRLAPFNYSAEELLRYRTDEVPAGQWNKLVLLHRACSR